MKDFEKLCDLVTSLIESNYPERLDTYPDRLKDLSTEIKEAEWTSDELLKLAHDAFKSDIQLYILFLSSVYLASFDPNYLVRIEELLTADLLDMYMTSALYLQTRYYRFTYGKSDDYPFIRALNRHISTRYLKELGADITPVPYELRNHDMVFVVTYQLLDPRHAPSRFVLSLCWYLQKYFGYQVQLLVMAEPVDANDVSAFWAGDIIMPTYKPAWGDQVINFKGENIYYYQIDLNHASKEKMLEVIGTLYLKRPEFIIQFGGLPRTDLIWRAMSTYISIPTGNNYEASDAHLLVSYQQSDPEADEVFLDSIGQRHMKMKFFSLPIDEKPQEEVYTKSTFNINESSFAIAIVGNRLDDEITPDFLKLLSRILKENDDVCFVIIGKYELPLPEDIDSHTYRLGYRDDFLQTIKVTDLFLNPKRSGGAGGSNRALLNGIPVITLPGCDVSAFAGDAFTCKNYDEMAALTHKYITDKEFYKSQSQKAREVFKQDSTTDMKTELQRVIDTAIEIAKNTQHQ